MKESGENSRLLEHQSEYPSPSTSTIASTGVECKVYKRRWYVLFVFTAEAFIFSLTWNTWDPIQESCKVALGWTDFNLLLLSSWTPIALLATSLPLTWLMDSKGLRVSVLLTTFSAVLGKGLQVIPFYDTTIRTIFINLGQFLCMIMGIVALGAPPLVSATWFPPSERTTATAIGTLVGNFGISTAFLVGPAMVPGVDAQTNVSNASISNSTRDLIHGQILQYTYIELGLCTAVFLCVLVYFPARPPLPPSMTSSTPHKVSTKASVKKVMKNRQFLLLITITALILGIYFGWLSMLSDFLDKFHVDAVTAGWLGCSSILGGVASGIIVGRCADYVKHRTKQLAVLLLVLSSISQLVFSLSCAGILPSTKPILFSSIIFGGVFFNGTTPLLFELAMEYVYPVGGGIVGGVVIGVENVLVLFLYVAFMLPHSDLRGMNWVLTSVYVVAVISLLMFREKYTRLDLDTQLKT